MASSFSRLTYYSFVNVYSHGVEIYEKRLQGRATVGGPNQDPRTETWGIEKWQSVRVKTRYSQWVMISTIGR